MFSQKDLKQDRGSFLKSKSPIQSNCSFFHLTSQAFLLSFANGDLLNVHDLDRLSNRCNESNAKQFKLKV